MFVSIIKSTCRRGRRQVAVTLLWFMALDKRSVAPNRRSNFAVAPLGRDTECVFPPSFFHIYSLMNSNVNCRSVESLCITRLCFPDVDELYCLCVTRSSSDSSFRQAGHILWCVPLWKRNTTRNQLTPFFSSAISRRWLVASTLE